MIHDRIRPGRPRRRPGLPPTWCAAILVILITVLAAAAWWLSTLPAQGGVR